MRVISGKYKGRKIEGYDIEGTRPTQDRIKESMFAIIQNELVDSMILDLFAGSGNLGIEALSNGSKFSYFVDINSKCIEVLNKNLNGINKNDYKVLKMDYVDALSYLKNEGIKFNVIFLDPPYNLNCMDDILKKIVKFDLLADDGIVVCEYEFDNFDNGYIGLELEKEKKYGYKNIRIYRKENV